ncbi:Ig-like domain-containing protein [Tundrisphaera sp. TA3]|uniref:Ig-like domain-containing protein n=1 Tax=Tundrisphaera sp. TA3 TaxID=3435775 RepID=UPI003EBD6AB5
MIRPHLAWMLSALALSAIAADGPGPSVRWVDDASGRIVAVEVIGLPAGSLDAAPGPDALSVRIEGAARPMLGTCRVVGDVLRFEPRFPLDRGRTYRANYRVAGSEGESAHLVPKPARPATSVTRIDPAADRVPENLLKFYVHFSAPMARGEAYTRVRILDGEGHPLDLPFLELGEELWDRSGTRITLLLDPGRIKQGLKPREDLGPILEAGRSYTLEVLPAWRDAEGEPLAAGARKRFAVGPADAVQPDPRTWAIDAPAAGTRRPLVVRFPEPLDRAMLESGLALVDPRGGPVAGRATVDDGATAWRFAPDRPWAAGEHALQVEDDLEDLAGNSVRRPFEVDAARPITARPESGTVRVPVPIR